METFENHQSFNRHLSIEGYRVNTSGNVPSVYITIVKLKRSLNELSDVEIENIFEKEMSAFAIQIQRQKLVEKMEDMQRWQLMKALDVLMGEGRIEAITYVRKCRRSNKNID